MGNVRGRGAAHRELTARAFVWGMLPSPLVATGAASLVSLVNPTALPVAAPVLLLWISAPLVALSLSRPIAPRIEPLTTADRAYLTSVAAATWKYFATFVDAEHHHLPVDNVQFDGDARVANRTSPTNIGMGLLATLAAHDFGFIDTAGLLTRVDGTLTTVEGLERHEGHLFNWVRHGDARATHAALCLDRGQRQPGRRAHHARVRSPRDGVGQRDWPPISGSSRSLPHAPPCCSTTMNFGFLYNPKRRLFSIGYRPADGDGPGGLDVSYYDLLASEARLASFVAIAKGDVPEVHWFHLGRRITSVHGAPVLLSWSATQFEYLMPLLFMRSYPEHAARRLVPDGGSPPAGYGPRGTRPGGSRVRVHHRRSPRHVQYKAFGIPGLGLKRGLGDELVVAPYASALAASIAPAQSADNLRRLAREHAFGEYGFFDAIDYTERETDKPAVAAGGRGGAGVFRPSRRDDAGGARQRGARRPHGDAVPRGPRVSRQPSCCCRSAFRGIGRRSSRGRSTRCASARRRRRCRSVATARRTRRFRTRSSCRMAAYVA